MVLVSKDENLTYHDVEFRRVREKKPTILVVSFGSVRGTHDRASSSTTQAILHFRDAYPHVTIDHHQMASTYNNNMQDEWCISKFRDHCEYYIRQDYDQIIKRDHIVKLYEFMEKNKDVFLASPRCNSREGAPLSYNDQYKRMPIWLPFDEEGRRVSKYVSYNAAMFRMEMFNFMEPPYFTDMYVSNGDKQAKRIDGLAMMNHKSNQAGLKKVMLYNIVVGHIREEENWPQENLVLFNTIACGKVHR